MKSIKILLPAALTFTMALGITSTYAQSAYTGTTNKPVNSALLNILPKKAIGLDYAQTLVQITSALKGGVKSDDIINFQGKVILDIAIDADGNVQTIAFDKNLSPKLTEAIEDALKAKPITPVSLNGIAKAQTFKIPLRIK